MDTAVAQPPRAPRAPSTSRLLVQLAESFPHERVSVGELLDRLEGRAIGLMLLILALPMCIPNIPGISTVFGVLLIAPAVQLIIGGRRLWLPANMRRWTFPREGLRKAAAGAAPWLQRVESLIRPRFTALTQFPVTIYFGVQTLILAIVLILPIPGGNWPPGMTIALTALALLERDGLLAALSAAAAIASSVAAYFFFIWGVRAMNKLGEVWSVWFAGLF